LIERFIDEQNVEKPTVEKPKPKSKRQLQIDQIMQKEELSTRNAIRIAKLAEKEAQENKKVAVIEPLEIVKTYTVEHDDSATMRGIDYWNELRPNPLTSEELVSFRINDSLKQSGISIKDSINQVPPKKKNVSKLLMGSTWNFKRDSIELNYKGLVSPALLGFNAVEGLKYGQKFSVKLKLKKQQELTNTVYLGYSFGQNLFQYSFDGNWLYSPQKMGKFHLEAGNTITDILGTNGISPFVNSISSLFFKENFARHQQQKFVSLTNDIEISNGLLLKTGFDFYNRTPLKNATNFSFLNQSKLYHPNEIEDMNGNVLQQTPSKSAIITVGLTYVPRQHYRIRDGKKTPAWSAWPEFLLTYQKAIKNLFGATSSWESLVFGLQQKIKTGTTSNLAYTFRSGIFLNTQSIPYAEYFRFNTNPVPFNINAPASGFQFLPYYKHNSSDRFFELHTTYTTSYLLLKYLPWFSERLLSENLHLSFLTKPGLQNYTELGYSISEIFFVGEAGVFAGFENRKYSSTGVRITLKF
jgi:hypothetical protein